MNIKSHVYQNFNLYIFKPKLRVIYQVISLLQVCVSNVILSIKLTTK